jgi:hypothetical protein
MTPGSSTTHEDEWLRDYRQRMTAKVSQRKPPEEDALHEQEDRIIIRHIPK